MKKILMSVAMIAAAAAIVVGATTAYFSDTETSTGNTFTAGTIDIHVTGDNFTWTQGAELADMKPCYTDYINFTIYNDGSDPNPVNVWKHLMDFKFDTGAQSEPECTEEEGEWNEESNKCINMGKPDNEIDKAILYDMIVEVYDGEELIWWQTIYDEEVDLDKLESHNMYLGMIPVNGYMKVIQSYHMDKDTTNWAQGDELTFDIEIYAEQLHGTAWLDFKQEKKSPEYYWKVKNPGNPAGTLTYEVKHPEFDYSFTASGLQNDTNYSLIYYADPWNGDGPTGTGGALIGTAMSDGSGGLTMSDSVELDMSLPGNDDDNYPHGAKIWLVPSSDYNAGTNEMTAWNPDNYLFEIGLIWYEDTDL